MLRKITAYEFANTILNARAGIQVVPRLQARHNLSLKEKRRAKTDVEKEMYNNQISTVMWG
jgi:hypothetical protein